MVAMDMSAMSMMDLFRQEAERHCQTMTGYLRGLGDEPAGEEVLSELVRAAHSLKGAARIMDLNVIVGLTRALEDVFNAAKKGTISLDAEAVALLQKGVDTLGGIASLADEEVEAWLAGRQNVIEEYRGCYAALATGEDYSRLVPVEEDVAEPVEDAFSARDYVFPERQPEEEPEPAAAVEAVPKETVKPSKGSGKKKKKESLADLSSLSMMDLFRQEAELHCATLSDKLLALEKNPEEPESLAALMRAAHSIKGAARIIELHMVVGLAHAMEDVFVAAQEGRIVLGQDHVDLLLRGTDLFSEIAVREDGELNAWFAKHGQSIKDLEEVLKKVATGQDAVLLSKAPVKEEKPVEPEPAAVQAVFPAEEEKIEAVAKPAEKPVKQAVQDKDDDPARQADRFLRVSAEGMNRLMGFAGEVQVESRWLPSFAQKILRLKHRQDEVHRLLNNYILRRGAGNSEELNLSNLNSLIGKVDICRNLGNEILGEVEDHARRANEISYHLYQEVLANRMRPFADGVRAFPRMVRDIARELGKKVNFEIIGEETLVDRDILEKIEAPLNHLIRNALDHGVEYPEQRLAAGKSETARIRLEARHSAGLLNIVISDDGPGIDIEKLRRTIIEKKMVSEDMANQLRDSELLEFIYLPNFSTRDSVSEVSGRGVGLDVVHSAVHEVRGIIRTGTEEGVGTTFELQLPLTLSVMRTLLVEIAGEVYAFPLVGIDHVVRLQEDVKEVEGRQYITFNKERIGLVSARQVLEKEDRKDKDEDDDLLIVIISDRYNRYGMIVDAFLEIRDLVVQPLDRRLKKVQDINAVAILEDGTPVLIFDVEDMVRSVNSLISGNRLRRIGTEEFMAERTEKKILVVDDSITVREVERKMLANKGYEVKTAVDGLEGWNILRSEKFDLVVSDVDMPRMDGIEFVTHIRQDPRYQAIPVIIVSYKDREEDRNRGLEAGADYYLTKGSFQDETLVRTVEELIGPPQRTAR